MAGVNAALLRAGLNKRLMDLLFLRVSQMTGNRTAVRDISLRLFIDFSVRGIEPDRLVVVHSEVAMRRAMLPGSAASTLATRRNIDEAVSPSEACALGQKNRPVTRPIGYPAN